MKVLVADAKAVPEPRLRLALEKYAVKDHNQKVSSLSADYIWSVDRAAWSHEPPIPAVSSVANIANGRSTDEFLVSRSRSMRARMVPAARHVSATQLVNVGHRQLELGPTAPTDPCLLASDPLGRLRTQMGQTLLPIPPLPQPMPKVEATLSHRHKTVTGSWRGNELALSQWDTQDDRRDFCNSAAEARQRHASQNARKQLSVLLSEVGGYKSTPLVHNRGSTQRGR